MEEMHVDTYHGVCSFRLGRIVTIRLGFYEIYQHKQKYKQITEMDGIRIYMNEHDDVRNSWI